MDRIHIVVARLITMTGRASFHHLCRADLLSMRLDDRALACFHLNLRYRGRIGSKIVVKAVVVFVIVQTAGLTQVLILQWVGKVAGLVVRSV